MRPPLLQLLKPKHFTLKHSAGTCRDFHCALDSGGPFGSVEGSFPLVCLAWGVCVWGGWFSLCVRLLFVDHLPETCTKISYSAFQIFFP